jgi:hypothetical protein
MIEERGAENRTALILLGVQSSELIRFDKIGLQQLFWCFNTERPAAAPE